MNELKELLDLSNSLYDITDIHKRFEEIAKQLMCSYEIKKGEKQYAIVEIEFYLYNKYHKDYITYPREVKEAGKWFFHQSGVDLSFNSVDVDIKENPETNKVTYTLKQNPSFGGILIRGIYDIKKEKYIFGPQRCVNVLWDCFDAFGTTKDEYPVLEKVNNECTGNIYQCKRHINIKEEDKQRKSIENWIKRLGLTESEKDIDNYQKNLFGESEEYRYRFFNMQNGEDPCKFTEIPSAVRPKQEDTKRVS